MSIDVDIHIHSILPSIEDIKLCIKYAIDILDAQGWCQYTSMDQQEQVCAGMAITLAAQKIAMSSAFRQHVLDNDVNAYMQTKLCARSIVAWNDEQGRTKEQVIQAFEGAMS